MPPAPAPAGTRRGNPAKPQAARRRTRPDLVSVVLRDLAGPIGSGELCNLSLRSDRRRKNRTRSPDPAVLRPTHGSRALPASWLTSTANHIRRGLFPCRRCPCLCRRLPSGGHPAGYLTGRRAGADRVFRNAANGTGRGRMRSDGSLSARRPARGLILSTGEAVPNGHSRAHGWSWSKCAPDDVAWECMSDLPAVRRRTGRLPPSWPRYIKWVASQVPAPDPEPDRVNSVPQFTGAGGLHRRMPTNTSQTSQSGCGSSWTSRSMSAAISATESQATLASGHRRFHHCRRGTAYTRGAGRPRSPLLRATRVRSCDRPGAHPRLGSDQQPSCNSSQRQSTLN